MLLPSIEGEKEGKWIVIDSGMFTSLLVYLSGLFGHLFLCSAGGYWHHSLKNYKVP